MFLIIIATQLSFSIYDMIDKGGQALNEASDRKGQSG